MDLDCGPILVVDGDGDARAFVARLLRRLGYVTQEVATGEEALEAAARERPLLVLLEVRLPDTSGYEICRELRDEFGERLPIVFVSKDRTEPSDIVAGLLVGADDYIVKPFGADELLARVRRLLARSTSAAPFGAPELTEREREVLSLLADGLRQTQIARRLSVSPKTVGKHIEHILGKLGVHSRTEAVALALRNRPVGPAATARRSRLPGRDPRHQVEERAGDREIEKGAQKRTSRTTGRG